MSDQKQARRIYISGRVQGVGYRFFARSAARRQGVTGFARNLRDGRVEIYAVGTETQLGAMLAELRRGPGPASVDGVSEIEAEVLSQFAAGFSIEGDTEDTAIERTNTT